MAAFTFSPAAHIPHSLRILSNCSSPRKFLTIPFCSPPYPSLLFPSKLERLRSPLNHRRPSHAVSALRKISESELVAVSSEAEGLLPSDSGVYAVYDGNGDLQFVGITRNLAASVLAHKNSVPELCVSVKVGVVHDPDKNALTEAWRSWLQEHISSTGKVPPGNEPGNSTWAQNRPPRKKSDLRLTPGPDTRLTVPLESLIDRVVKENKVVAFIKGSRGAPRCGFSQRVVGILESQGVEYESVDVLDEEHNRGLREALKKYSNWPTFPQVFVGGELVGGCDILMAMYEKGELSSLLK